VGRQQIDAVRWGSTSLAQLLGAIVGALRIKAVFPALGITHYFACEPPQVLIIPFYSICAHSPGSALTFFLR